MYLQACGANGTQEAFGFSDATASQKRSYILIAALYQFLFRDAKNIEKIHIVYLLTGHLQNEEDSIHLVIERVSRHVDVYTPNNWASIIKAARPKQPFKLHEIDTSNFIQWKQIARHLFGAAPFFIEGSPANVSKTRWIVITNWATTCEGNFADVQFRPHRKCSGGEYRILIKEKRGISYTKKKDLVALCKANYIPSIHHSF